MSKKTPKPVRALNQALIIAATQNDALAVRRLLADGADPTDKGSSAFSLAARDGCAAAAEELAPFPHEPRVFNFALRCLAGAGHARAVRAVVEFWGAALFVDAALDEAASGGHLECVKILAPLAAPEAIATPLRESAIAGRLDIVEALLPFSDPGLGLSDARGQAFFRACGEGRVDIAAFLAPHCDLDAIAPSSLMLASYSHSPQIIEFLLPLTCPKNWLCVARNAMETPERPALAWIAQALPDDALVELVREARELKFHWAVKTLRPLTRARQERQALERAVAAAPSRERSGL